jgi:hypothetical protein
VLPRWVAVCTAGRRMYVREQRHTGRRKYVVARSSASDGSIAGSGAAGVSFNVITPAYAADESAR